MTSLIWSGGRLSSSLASLLLMSSAGLASPLYPVFGLLFTFLLMTLGFVPLLQGVELDFFSPSLAVVSSS
jgi:hypothetical protein